MTGNCDDLKVHYSAKSPLLAPVLSQMYPINTCPTLPFFLSRNLI